jgi:polyphenol oxidase
MWLKAPNINCLHGFSTRHGGVSLPPFHSLNMGGSDDDRAAVQQNRIIALDDLGLSATKLCLLQQEHGNIVRQAKPGKQVGDAIVSAEKELVLAVSIADCYPILFYDEIHGVIGAAHAGWRGTVKQIAGHTVDAMLQLGADPSQIKVAIGQGISQKKFEVGPEVIEEFKKNNFPESCWSESRVNLDLCNRVVLQRHGILAENIWSLNRCTFEEDFFSYRRDRGKTGRMWALISMK